MKTDYECVELIHHFQDRILWRVAFHTSMDLSYIKTQDNEFLATINMYI
jgi:hypothetical protein